MIIFQDLCITTEQLQCVNGTKVDDSECYNKCEGMNVISYNEYEVDSELTRHISKLSGHAKISKYVANPKLNNHISKLSKIYREYKGAYEFSAEFQDKLDSLPTCYYSSILDYRFSSKLHYIKIYFATPMLDRITKESLPE